jgi:hypothetical protein
VSSCPYRPPYTKTCKEKREPETVDTALSTIVYIGGLKDKREISKEVARAAGMYLKEKREADFETVDYALGTLVYIGGLKE